MNNLVGKPLNEAINELKLTNSKYRIIEKDGFCLITADFQDDRINVVVNKDGVVVETYNG